MRLLLSSLLLLSIGLVVSANTSLPDKFYGKFTLDHSENFDEYLEAKGYGWFTRKLVTLATFEKVFTKGAGSTFDYENLTTKKNVAYKGVTLGKEFEGEGLDSEKHKITFYMKGDKLFEKHVPVNKSGEAKEEEYEYYFDGDFLLVKMEANGVIGKRFYKRVTA
ncbi:lbp-1 [Pristionchus pacificus]|uniref:Lbp-1 n=1 Tax=Pristionchus pacificus TaxID=54126 RepID=A0A2A6BF12_PRIPA|nr:lbp-1 [Pristionchus pacificus]|eukprot:PDM64495.1 lbp-1 [Pristionchus pacificus]